MRTIGNACFRYTLFAMSPRARGLRRAGTVVAFVMAAVGAVHMARMVA